MVAAVVLGTASYFLIVTVCYVATRIGYGRVRASGPLRPAVGPDDLSPYELAMLAGGRKRVGEVALAELFLTGRIVARGHGEVARASAGSPGPRPALSATPFVRALDARLQHDRPLPADRLAASAARGDAATATLWRLRRLGLFLAPERLRAIALARRSAWVSQAAAGASGVLFAGGAVLWSASLAPVLAPVTPALLALLLAYPFLLHLGYRWACGVQGLVGAAALVTAAGAAAGRFTGGPLLALAPFAGWFAVYTVYRCTGSRLGPRTTAGDAVLAETLADLADRRDPGLDGLLRLTALLGFRRLCGHSFGALRDTPVARAPRLARLAAFAAACGRSLGAPDRGLGGDFARDGTCGEWGEWGGDGLPPPLPEPPRSGRDRRGPSEERP
ncbi:TIGR04222 domain-containing membrane protein [Actinorugispora endophytica]|uniref:Uncharacterized protein (TIGR04222 family) n=1 Tax=Actinorugispora endophytica TaxID=1605990 RepID=A0A4R6URV7_9ACTN|nr:TIGR04222 domain-containing membrane protein [Actinorugispora endophytica]TDQ48499.1 uncharacterized protein (TIGR04222 family) [Actinorugispora endophytica]